MNAEQSTSQLSAELREAIESVKSALNLTTSQKKMLRENAVVAKSQIQDDLSFHLELLRNREVWLLEQVDVHAQIKEETFGSHLNELCVLLAKLEIYEQLLEAQELQESEEIIAQAQEVLSKIHNELLQSGEAAGICFSADNLALSNAVKNYGNIVEGRESREQARKVPRVQRKRVASRDRSLDLVFIQEHFKRVASSPQYDWLLAGGDENETRKDFGIHVWKYFEELKRSDSKEWLFEECQPMDMETVPNHFEFEVHFQQVKSTPPTEWLRSEMACDESNDSNGYPTYTSLDTSENIKAWLLRPFEGLSLSAKGEDLIDEGISLSRGEKYIDGKSGWLLDEKQMGESNQDSQEYPTGDQLGTDWLIGSCMSSVTSYPPSETGGWLQQFRESSGTSTNSDWLILPESEAENEWLASVTDC